MSATIYVDGESISIDDHTKSKEVKGLAGASRDHDLVIHSNGETTVIPNDDHVAEYVRDGDELHIQDPDAHDFSNLEDTTPDTDPETDGFHVTINNEPVRVEPGQTAKELKMNNGADPEDITVYKDPETGEDFNLHDNAVVEDHVPNMARVSFMPSPESEGGMFGHPNTR